MNKEIILDNNNTEELLRKHRLSVTESRLKILNLFMDQPGALAHGDIEKKPGKNLTG